MLVFMGKHVHVVEDGQCRNCGPGTLVPRPLKGGRKRLTCRNSSSVTGGRYSHKRIKRIAELGYVDSGLCEICGDECRPVTDHDHLTGKARGYLCSRCNMGLGLFRDNTEILSKAIDYLKR